jgi:uncharacterized protein YlxP (DUF503 family)
MAIEIHIPTSNSLKDKRMVVRPLLDGARARFHVSAAEVDFHDQWRRALLGFAVVSGRPVQVSATLDHVERFVWSHPELNVIEMTRDWLEFDR